MIAAIEGNEAIGARFSLGEMAIIALLAVPPSPCLAALVAGTVIGLFSENGLSGAVAVVLGPRI